MNIGRPLRVAASIALLIGGLVHLQLYFEGYRSIDKIGPSFLVNAIASAVVAALVFVRSEWFIRAAGMAVAIGTLGAFILSRRGAGLFDFREQGLHPSPQAAIAMIVEIAAFVLLAATFAPTVFDERAPTKTSTTALSLAASAVIVLGAGAYWANHYDSPSEVGGTGVGISNFVFGPSPLTVSKGATVTWTNGDGFDHSIVATDLSFHSQNIGQGATFAYTFDKPGDFTYVCGIHPQMTGTITVTG